MFRVAKAVTPLIVGATILTSFSSEGAFAGVPLANAAIYSQHAYAASPVQHVWWRGGWGWCGPGIAAGVLAGAAVGAAAAPYEALTR